MNFKTTSRAMAILVTLALLFSLLSTTAGAASNIAPSNPINFTILHTNDFHGQLELSGSNPGAARVANTIDTVRTAVGAANVLLFDVGDEMQGSLLSNLQKGLPTIDYYRTIGYNAATFGNHEFDWGQAILNDRITQAEAAAVIDELPMQYVSANITLKDASGNCTWTPFNSAVTPFEVFTVGTTPNVVRVGVIGVTSLETPYITIAEATAGLCFRDPAESILHYYEALDAASDVIVVLSHIGFTDGGYGYGFPVYGDQTLAANLNAAGKSVNVIIGGHSHTNVGGGGTNPNPVVVGKTLVTQAYYNGRVVGQINMTYDPSTGTVSSAWVRNAVSTNSAEYLPVKTLISAYTSDSAYQALINQPVGYAQMDLTRNTHGDAIMGDFVDDAIYGALNSDGDSTNDVDMFFNNPGGIRTDWCDQESPAGSGNYIWATSGCTMEGIWSHDPMLLTYGNMFTILPFGNATAVGTMTGAQIYELLQQAAGNSGTGVIQPSGIRFKFWRYIDSLPAPAIATWGWGAYDIEVYDKDAKAWLPLDFDKTYKVGTNEFLAPAGQDGFTGFKYMKNITYWGDMLNAVNAYVSTHYTLSNPYKGPDGDGTLDGRITRNGNGNNTYEPGEVVPLTILHHNDSHGRLLQSGNTVGYTNLVTAINTETAHNPERTLLLSSGDNIQGDSMMYYFKSAGLGYAADGTALPPELQINPLIKAFNAVGYDAMTLGNHEFNFGKDIFSTLKQAKFPILQANVADTGAYGLSSTGIAPSTSEIVGPEGIKVSILGIGNHRVPSYELPSNIPGLTFSNPITTAQASASDLATHNDVVIALTHIGFTDDPNSVEVDANVDTNFAAQVADVDAVIGGHSHTNPASAFGTYKYLPTYVAGPNNTPVLVTQANRYNTYLGEVILGLLPNSNGGFDVVSKAGRYISINPTTYPEDPTVKALIAPYKSLIDSYNNTVIGRTTAPIDALQAYTQETNGANLQADAAVWKLESQKIDVDFHLSGAMTNSKIAATATPASPYSLKVSDMFTSMPYENSLLVMKMNGPQLKAVLERAYRNYYYYYHVPGYGGYSYYTTCMLDTNTDARIYYNDTYPAMPDGNNVNGLVVNGKAVDFTDASKYYNVSSVNYLAAGACNFSEGGKTLWPLDQIVADTQYYVRDAVIEYVQAQTAAINPQIEGRLLFGDTVAPVITINAPSAQNYLQPDYLTLDFSAVDGTGGTTPNIAPASGVKGIVARIDGTTAVTNNQKVDLHTLAPGDHTLRVTATDYYGNATVQSVTFSVIATVQTMNTSVNRLYTEGAINDASIRNSLLSKLNEAQTYLNKGNTKAAINTLNAFISSVKAQSGKHITKAAANLLIADANYVIAHPK